MNILDFYEYSLEGQDWTEAFRRAIDELRKHLWDNLNEDNKVSLFVRYIDIENGEYETRIVNKNQ